MQALDNALDAAQVETIAAELALIEATARAEAAREASARLEAAVAALNGESATPTVKLPDIPKLSTETPISAERQATADMTPEEFDKERQRRQRAKQKELDAQNPYAQLKCSGCGEIGKLIENIIQAPSGVPVRMLVCNGCGNQNII